MLLPLLLVASPTTAAETSSAADSRQLVEEHRDLHKVVSGGSCTYSRPGTCLRELEIVGHATITVRIKDPQALDAQARQRALEAAEVSRQEAGKCVRRLRLEEVMTASSHTVVHRAQAAPSRNDAWELRGAAFVASCLAHQTKVTPLPEGAPALVVTIDLEPPKTHGVRTLR